MAVQDDAAKSTSVAWFTVIPPEVLDAKAPGGAGCAEQWQDAWLRRLFRSKLILECFNSQLITHSNSFCI